MKVKKWLKITHVEDFLNLRVDKEFYNSKKDDEKDINYVTVQDNGVVIIHTK